MLRTLIVVAMTLLVPQFNSPLSAQEATKAVKVKFKESIDELLRINSENRREFRSVWNEMRITSNSFHKLVDNKNGNSEELLQSMDANADALRSVLSQDFTDDQKLTICKSISTDMKLKEQYVRATSSFSIKAKVHTKKGTAEVSGCQVWYVPAGWAYEVRRHRKFDRVSSPTEKPLPPGMYVMWAKLEDKEGERQYVAIGEDNRDLVVLDLKAP